MSLERAKGKKKFLIVLNIIIISSRIFFLTFTNFFMIIKILTFPLFI